MFFLGGAKFLQLGDGVFGGVDGGTDVVFHVQGALDQFKGGEE